MGPFKCYVTQMGVGGGGGCQIFREKKHYEDVRFNVISVTRGWVGVQFPGKTHYVTLEWPQWLRQLSGLLAVYSRGGQPFQSEGQMRLSGAARGPE